MTSHLSQNQGGGNSTSNGLPKAAKGVTGRAQVKDAGMARRPLHNNYRAIPHHSNKSCSNSGRFHAKRNCMG
ncbi:hypothetical protein DPMN_002427 [Dreissena polymorpha]|uniref:Uncharacterized protein n=1 Tax=Dreissena polymorpha TaxID=45954 RepID=A0A9D4MN39_DREPO|nr:hypothetical protein DPMN_002427 [Dreissena polymorpha]